MILAHMVLMGLSLVYVGAHWLTDVVAGRTTALGWICPVLVAHRLLLRRSETRARSVW